MIGADAADELDDDELDDDELDALGALGGFIHPVKIRNDTCAFVISSFVSGLAAGGELSLFSSSPAAAAAGLRPFGDFDLGLALVFHSWFYNEGKNSYFFLKLRILLCNLYDILN
jgi:hypothetical protein